MALEDTDTLDMALKALDGRENGIDLLLFDHAKTTDEIERYNLLMQKLATYVAYFVDDKFRRNHPDTKPEDVLIRVLCKTPPNSAMQAVQAVTPRGDRINRIAVVFENLDEFLQQAGIETPEEETQERRQQEQGNKKKWWLLSR